MASFDQLANEYARRLLKANNKITEADRVVRAIEGLEYSKTKKKLSLEDKQKLVKAVEFQLNSHDDGKIMMYRVLEKSDNKDFLQLINYINSQLSGAK